MKNDMGDKEELVRRLVNTFNTREELHESYKRRIKEVLRIAIYQLGEDIEDVPNLDLNEWIEQFVELRFAPKD